MPFLSRNIGIDLGTANTRIYAQGNEFQLSEASAVAYDTKHKKLVGSGDEAKGMHGRTPSEIEVIYPLRDGVIADYHMTEIMLRSLLEKTLRRHTFFGPRVVIGVPAEATEVEKRAVEDVVLACGARAVTVVEEPIASAKGLGLNMNANEANMIVDIGGGTTEVSVISDMGIATGGSIRIGGDTLDNAIINYVKKNYSVLIGEPTAELIKKTIGSVASYEGETAMDFKGRDLLTGLPKTCSVTPDRVREALSDYVSSVLECIRRVLEKTPPELIGDITANGIYLTGGGSLLKGLDEYLSSEIGIKVSVAANAMTCIAEGIRKFMEEPGALKSYRVITRKNK